MGKRTLTIFRFFLVGFRLGTSQNLSWREGGGGGGGEMKFFRIKIRDPLKTLKKIEGPPLFWRVHVYFRTITSVS